MTLRAPGAAVEVIAGEPAADNARGRPVLTDNAGKMVAGPSPRVDGAGNWQPDRDPAGGPGDYLASPDAPVPVSEYARTRGVSPQAVRDAIHSGRLGGAASRDGAGHYHVRPLAADRAWGKAALVQVDGPCPYERGSAHCNTCENFDEAHALIVRLQMQVARHMRKRPASWPAFAAKIKTLFDHALVELCDVTKHPGAPRQ